uniref:Uncharacterized protein n=1 Tax=Rhabditophanes sp. KR3021 TaxID=114890 RepID=A0AC35TWR4_9BILA
MKLLNLKTKCPPTTSPTSAPTNSLAVEPEDIDVNVEIEDKDNAYVAADGLIEGLYYGREVYQNGQTITDDSQFTLSKSKSKIGPDVGGTTNLTTFIKTMNLKKLDYFHGECYQDKTSSIFSKKMETSFYVSLDQERMPCPVQRKDSCNTTDIRMTLEKLYKSPEGTKDLPNLTVASLKGDVNNKQVKISNSS